MMGGRQVQLRPISRVARVHLGPRTMILYTVNASPFIAINRVRVRSLFAMASFPEPAYQSNPRVEEF